MRVWGSDLFIIERQNSRKSVKHARFCKKGASLRIGKLYYLTNTVVTIPRGVYPLLIDTLSIYYTQCLYHTAYHIIFNAARQRYSARCRARLRAVYCILFEINRFTFQAGLLGKYFF